MASSLRGALKFLQGQSSQPVGKSDKARPLEKNGRPLRFAHFLPDAPFSQRHSPGIASAIDGTITATLGSRHIDGFQQHQRT
jgi:hypothetical protein